MITKLKLINGKPNKPGFVSMKRKVLSRSMHAQESPEILTIFHDYLAFITKLLNENVGKNGPFISQNQIFLVSLT